MHLLLAMGAVSIFYFFVAVVDTNKHVILVRFLRKYLPVIVDRYAHFAALRSDNERREGSLLEFARG